MRSSRAMAEAMGLSHRSVQRIWDEAGLKPRLGKRFKVSNDPHFEQKVTDVVDLYLDPPDRVLVLCVDEKSQIQTLDRTQPDLPLKRGRAATMTHDYKRHGTTTLFATLDGQAVSSSGNASHAIAPRSSCRSCARSTGVKKSLDVHPVLDNYGTHKTPEVKAWLAKHQRFHCHFTPTSASWLNLVGRFFAEITTNRNRRGTFTSVAELEDAIYDYLLRHNVDPKPFVWTKSAEDILARERRALDLLDIIRDGYQPSESEHLLQPSSRCGASLRASVHFLPYPRFNLCLVCGTDV